VDIRGWRPSHKRELTVEITSRALRSWGGGGGGGENSGRGAGVGGWGAACPRLGEKKNTKPVKNNMEYGNDGQDYTKYRLGKGTVKGKITSARNPVTHALWVSFRSKKSNDNNGAPTKCSWTGGGRVSHLTARLET